MNFNTKVTGCYWNEDKGQWRVTLQETKPGQEPREFEDWCDILMQGTGILNNYKWPDIKGLKDKFKGRVVHTAQWPKDYQAEQWKNDRVAVIGSGASSIQTVPTMQPHAKHLDVFVRTAVWFVQIANNHGQNHQYAEEDKATYKKDPSALVAHAKSIEDQVSRRYCDD
jgi:hydroxyversicolorone monooxygenase